MRIGFDRDPAKTASSGVKTAGAGAAPLRPEYPHDDRRASFAWDSRSAHAQLIYITVFAPRPA